MGSSQLRKWEEFSLQMGSFTADPKLLFLFSLLKLQTKLSVCFCSQSLLLLNLGFSQTLPIFSISLCSLTLAKLDLSVNLILSAVSLSETLQILF